jgi:hypothetical protein
MLGSAQHKQPCTLLEQNISGPGKTSRQLNSSPGREMSIKNREYGRAWVVAETTVMADRENIVA